MACCPQQGVGLGEILWSIDIEEGVDMPPADLDWREEYFDGRRAAWSMRRPFACLASSESSSSRGHRDGPKSNDRVHAFLRCCDEERRMIAQLGEKPVHEISREKTGYRSATVTT